MHPFGGSGQISIKQIDYVHSTGSALGSGRCVVVSGWCLIGRQDGRKRLCVVHQYSESMRYLLTIGRVIRREHRHGALWSSYRGLEDISFSRNDRNHIRVVGRGRGRFPRCAITAADTVRMHIMAIADKVEHQKRARDAPQNGQTVHHLHSVRRQKSAQNHALQHIRGDGCFAHKTHAVDDLIASFELIGGCKMAIETGHLKWHILSEFIIT